MREDAERFGDKRRTFIEEAERVTVSMVEAVVDEAVTVLLSRNGFLRSLSGHGIDQAALTWKEGDGPLAIIETRTVLPIVAMGANGRAYNLKAAELPGGKGDGAPISSLADTQGTSIVGLVSGAPETALLMATAGGFALRAKLEGLITRQRAGKQFVSVGEGDALMAVAPYPVDAKEAAALSAEGRLLVFPMEEVNELPNGGRGVVAMKLHDNEKMVGFTAVGPAGLKVAAIGRGDKRITVEIAPKSLAHYRGNRARSGRVLEQKVKRAEGFEA